MNILIFLLLLFCVSCSKQPINVSLIPELVFFINKDSVNVSEKFELFWESFNSEQVVINNIKKNTTGSEIVSISDTNKIGWNIFYAKAISELDTIQKIDSVFVKPPNQFFQLNSILSINADDSLKNVASFQIHYPGVYTILAEVWYNSGDDQKNESFYITISSPELFPIDSNAGIYKVVEDIPNFQSVISRNCGKFLLSKGTWNVNVFHYSIISDQYPEFLNGKIDVDSVKIISFDIVWQ